MAIEVAAQTEVGNRHFLPFDRRHPGVRPAHQDRPKVMARIGPIVLLAVLAGDPLMHFPGQRAEAFA